MVIQNDFDIMFETLDASCQGFLSDMEIQSFYVSLFGKHVHHILVKYVLRRFGGTDKESECLKKCFENVLLKIEEIKALEESIYWDFMSLDQNGSHLVSSKNGYLLARELQDKGFPLKKWQDWVNARNNPISPISWCEFQQYIYTIPGTTIHDDNIGDEVSAFEMQEAEETNSKYKDLKQVLDDELHLAQLAEERQEYLSGVSYESRRLLNRWDVAGVESVIWDDGTEMELVEKAQEKRDTVSVQDLVTAINIKYDLLRSRIMRDMASFHTGHTAEFGEDVEDVLLQIKEKEQKLRHSNNREGYHSLPGFDMEYNFNPVWITGETPDKYLAKWKEMVSTNKKLRAEGKSSLEINKILEDETLAQAKGTVLATEVLQYVTSRQKEETEYLLKSLQGSPSSSVNANRIALYSSIHRQCLRAEDYKLFELSAMWACLAERSQLSDFERYSPDQSRQEKVSFELLKQGDEEKIGRNIPSVVKLTNVSQSKNLGAVDSWLEVTRLMAQKHSAEREMMMHFLLNATYQEQVTEMEQQTKKELLDMKKNLTKDHDNWHHSITSGSLSRDEKAEKRVHHLSILSKAAAVYHACLAKDLGEEHHLIRKILGRLQVLQDIESEKLFEQMKSMTVGDIFKLRKDIYRSARDEFFDNVSALLFGVVQLSPEEEELVAVILSKYDKLRTKMFEDFVNKQNLKSDSEKQTMIEKIRVGEAKNRNARNHLKLSRLSKDTFKISSPLQGLAGPLVSQFASEVEYYLEGILESGRKRKLIDEPAVGDFKNAEDNVLSELGVRYEDEVETILELLRSANPNEKPFLIAAEIAWQQWEMMHFNLDKEFSQAVTAMGLCGRMRAGQGRLRLRQDNRRYAGLAQERLVISPVLNVASLQATASKTTPTQSSLRRVLLCHASEWRKLHELLSDPSAEELRDAASMMNEDERVARLSEINSKRLALDVKSDDWQEDLVSLLEEASAIKYVTRMQNLKELSGGTIEVNHFDVIASIMADLQEEHDLNGVGWFQKAIQNPDVAGNIKDLVVVESKSCTNIFNVLCRYDGQTDDDKILQALDDKYDLLKDKLLAEALMNQLGAKRWNEMSERERQERLMKLKLLERKLRREGKFDELSQLLGGAAEDDARLRALLGMNREEYDRKLKERLAMRKRGQLAGIEEEDGMEEKDGDAFTDLSNRYEDEKDALLRLLQGQGDRYMSEKDRQKELARLRHQFQKSQREERFGAAALVLGLTERNARMGERFESDKKRQEELAKQRIAALKSKLTKGKGVPMTTISEEDEKIVRDGTKEEMMDAVLSKLELLSESERAWLLHIVNSQSEVASLKNQEPVKLAKTITPLEISDKLNALDLKLTDKHVNIQHSRIELAEASFYRQALIAHKEQDITEEGKDELDVKIMALLQEVQDAKSLQLTEEMLTMTEDRLIEMQETFLAWAKKGISENIPTALVGAADTDMEIEEALDGKFDAILAALVEKSLSDKYGEAKWNALSQQEKDELIADMMSKIKKLMAEGKTDEASALLGQSINENPELLALFGGNSEEEERARLEQERLKRKQERMKNGMSEEEADELMRQEAEADGEMLRQRRKNILENLKYDIDAQRAALLRQLDDSNRRLKEERIRQLEVAKLRLQERLMRRDNDFEAVAHLMSLSRLQADQLESEKERQRQLARKRLELHKQGKSVLDDADSTLKLPQGDDVEVLIDAVVKEMESKHAHERLSLIKIMTETASPGTEIRKNALNMNRSDMARKLSELYELRRLWRNDDPEATAINLEIAKENEDNREEDLQVVLLANLQKQQMQETEYLLNGLPGKNPETLRTIAKVQWQAKSDGWLDNIAESLLKKEKTSSEEDEVIKALEDKYDAMKDKLVAEALMKEMGEKKWDLLSEQERQRKIMMLKMKERKLRQQGKLDEASELFAFMLQSEDGVAHLLGEAKLSQEEKLKQRLENKKKLKEERLAAGLAVEDNILDSELDEQEETDKKKRKNVLLLLEHNLDEEREALLANLRRQDELVGSERRRQLELARLRREQRQITREDHWNAVTLVFNQAKKNEEMLAANIEANRARQVALAKERLASRKMRKQEKEAARQLFDATVIAQKLKDEEEEIKDESLSAPEFLTQELEKKQMKEREMFYLFLLAADMDETMKKEVTNLESEKIEVERKNLSKEREGWREQRFVDLLQGQEGEDETKKNNKRQSIAEGIVQQNKNFKRYILLKLEAYRRQCEEPMDLAEAKNKLSVEWLAETQSAQDSAVDAVHTLIADKSDEVLDMITYGQKRARVEDWNDNIVKVIMEILPPGQAALQSADRQPSFISVESEEHAVEDAEKKIESLDEELEVQKKELERQKLNGENIDLDAEMSKLEQEHSDQKQALFNDLERQKKRAKERLLAKKRQRDEMEYEAHAAAAMVVLAERRLEMEKNRSSTEKSRQKSIMEERLEARKKRRQMLQEQEAGKEEEDAKPSEIKKTPSMPPPFGLVRERTVIDVNVSEKDKEKALKELQQISEQNMKKMMAEKERQKEKIKERLNKAKKSVTSQATRMIDQFQREKTLVIESKKKDLERQKTMLQDRVRTIRIEKTMTMKQKGDRKVHDFEKLLNQEESQAMSKDEKMERAAENLQKKMMADASSPDIKLNDDTNLTDGAVGGIDTSVTPDSVPNTPTNRMSTKQDKEKILKQRMEKRKLQKQEMGETVSQKVSEE